ncbi:hypothetical protein TU68_25000 [Bacillus cereus]|nr:hypothetical protein TU68_25000 [Bacillus cereus]MBR9743409.1 hypothetical protein [Bacillus cereus]
MLRVKHKSDGDELPSAGRLNSLVSLIVIFSVRMFVFLFYDISCLDKEGMDCKTTKLDNDSHSATCSISF